MTVIGPIEYSEAIKTSAQRTTSKNGLLQQLVSLVDQYNTRLPNLIRARQADKNFLIPAYMVESLDNICLACMAYLIYRPPGVRKESGQQKWKDVLDIQKTVMAHADFFGVRVLRGDFGKDTAENYWLERAFPLQPGSGANTDIADMTRRPKIDDYDYWVSYGVKEPFLASLESRPHTLQYFTALARNALAVEGSGGALTSRGEPLDTIDAASEAAYSGLKNVWIYVCSAKDRKIYSYHSKEDVTHHSSFLRGEPVLAAGDWLVIQGRVKYLNAESGHYQPTIDNMRMFASQYRHLWSPDTLIQPTHKGPIVSMAHFVNFGSANTPASASQINELVHYLGPRILGH